MQLVSIPVCKKDLFARSLIILGWSCGGAECLQNALQWLRTEKQTISKYFTKEPTWMQGIHKFIFEGSIKSSKFVKLCKGWEEQENWNNRVSAMFCQIPTDLKKC